MHCGDDTESMITSIYGDLLQSSNNNQLQDKYFMCCITLIPTNVEVHELNSVILNKVSGDNKEYLSVDSVSNRA
ncbi:hypothetical protein ID866_10076 [Astraeus odoratus]|nr:hypothetical protein ID866_10076 [Astraeus odoratus]